MALDDRQLDRVEARAVAGVAGPADLVDLDQQRVAVTVEADLADALSRVLADPARAREMGLAGRRRAVEAFSWPAVATRTLDLYRTLL